MAEHTPQTAIMKINHGSISDRVVVVGDPKRAEYVSTLMEGAVKVAENREYVTFTGTYKGKQVTVASHGVGGGGASMAFEELIQAGAKVIIRAGTCGSLSPKYREGNLIVTTGAVRNDGVTDNLIPREFPAVCDYTVVSSLVDVMKASGENWGLGLCVTDGPFYEGPLGNRNELWAKANVIAIEMEVSVLLVIASLRGIKAGAILNVDNYIFDRMVEGEYKPHKPEVAAGTQRMAKHVLEAVINVPL